jgi:hypothetical protein
MEDVRLRINVERWERVLIIASVLFASFFLVIFTPQRLISLLVVIPLGLAAVLVLLRWPPLGFLGILFGSLFVPFSGPGGFNVAILGVALMLGLWLFEMIVRQRRIYLMPSPTTYPMIAFTISALLSFGIGQLPWYIFASNAPIVTQLGGLSISILSAGAFLMVANQIKDLRWLKTFSWAFVVIGGIYVLGRLVPDFGRITDRLFQRGAIAGSIFWVWLVVIPISQVLFNRDLGLKWKAGLVGLVLATLYVAIVQTSDWKSGYIPPLAGAAAIIGFRFKRYVWLFIPFGILLAIYLFNEAIATDQYSYSTRLEAWQIVLEISKANPITGLGFANYRWYTPLFPIRGYRVLFNSHSQYVDIIAQTGLVGLVCFTWVFWSVGKLGWSQRDRVPEGFAKAYVIGALGGLVGMIVAGGFVDWILPFAYNIGMDGFRASILGWIFLGGVVSIEQIVKLQSTSQKVE